MRLACFGSPREIARTLACLVVVLVASCGPEGTSHLSRLQTPQSLSDLLVNVKEVTRSGLILEYDFYTDESLRRVFGGTIVAVWVAFNGFRQGADVSGFPAWSDRGSRGALAPDALTIRISRSFDLHGEPRAEIFVRSATNTDLSFETVEQLFGKKWDRVFPMVAIHGPDSGPPPGPPASRPHGNEKIEYQLADPRLMRTLLVSFASDATFEYARGTANQH